MKKNRNREWWDHIGRTGREYDGRRKLTEQDEENIRKLHKEGVAIREIAREYEGKCSRRLVQFVIFPERKDHAQRLFIERRKDGRYDHHHTKEKQREDMRKHRAKLKELHDKGLIK